MIINALTAKRLARSLSALFAVVLLSAGVALSAPPPLAHAATPTQLTNLTFSWMGGLLAKTQVRYVTVSLTLVDPDGIVPLSVQSGPGRVDCPCVVVEHVVSVDRNSRSNRTVHLHLASGTNTNGVWSGRFALGAADAGFWRPGEMAAGDFVSYLPTVPGVVWTAAVPAPLNQTTINVRGYDWPRAWLGTPVATGSVFTVRGGAALSRSGAPVAGMRLEIHGFCSSYNQWAEHLTYTAVRTDTHGRYAYTLTPTQQRNGSDFCAAAVAYPTDTRDSFVFQSNIRRAPYVS
jgi:hypothetical protein